MIQDEAIEYLFDIKTDAVYRILSVEKEAIDMAIEALTQPQIIRCKDCVHWKHSNIRPNYCDIWEWCNQADDFCSFAERKKE